MIDKGEETATTIWSTDLPDMEKGVEMAKEKDNRLIWLDMEMTGLNPETDRVLEIAVVVTDNELNEIAASPALTVQQSESIISAMDQWNTEHHNESGLLERVRADGLSEEQVELRMLQFLRPLVNPNVSPMCGNSVCQDRRFLARWMPELEKYFHYRHLDVSTLKELYKRWCPGEPVFGKKYEHLALEDIRDSIRELRFYREHFIQR